MSVTFFNALKPVNSFLKILGLSPYRLTTSKIARSVPAIIWSAIILLLLQTYLVITIIYLPKRHRNKFINNTIEFFDVYSGVFIILCGFICQWLFALDIITIINTINKFDQYAREQFQIDLERKYKTMKKYSIIAIAGTLILIFFSIASTVSINIGHQSFAGHLTNITIPKMISSLILLPFFILILSLRQRFVWTNNAIFRQHQVLHKAIANNVANSFLQTHILKFVEGVRVKHSSLCTMSRTLNKAYHAQVLAILAKNIISIIVGIFYCGNAIINKRFMFTLLFFPITEATASLIQTLALALVCSETSIQARKVVELLHKLYVINNSDGYYNSLKKKIHLEIMFFSLQVLQNKVEFTVFRMFVIREKFLVSVVATIFTYLIIVIQLSFLTK